MQEKNINILSAKQIDETLIRQAFAEHIQIDAINFIETKTVDDFSVTTKIKQYADEKITALFTSVNAVNAVFSSIDKKPEWKIFCISGATKNALSNIINETKIIGTADNASALADKIVENTTVKSCVFFCGNQRLNTLPDKLLRQNIHLEELVVYRTIPAPKKIEKQYDGILFFSPSAVESFFSVNKIDNKTVLFSIGKTTTKAIRKFTNNQIITAQFPAAESVVKEVKRFMNDDFSPLSSTL